MPLQEDATHDDSQTYYEEFSLRVGERDWLTPNRRHAYLRQLLLDVLPPRGDMRLLDVGCGAGVMTSFLPRYGRVVGTDFSTAAIDAAKRLVPEVDFFAGDLSSIPAGRYDVVTLFDVLEHIPSDDRPAFLVQLRGLLDDRGILFMSTPYPAFTRRRKAEDDRTLQIIDEEVEVARVIPEAAEAGLQLVHYRAFDVFKGSPEYQLMVFSPEGGSLGGPPQLADGRVRVPSARLWRLRNATRLVRAKRYRSAWWMLTGTPPDLKS